MRRYGWGRGNWLHAQRAVINGEIEDKQDMTVWQREGITCVSSGFKHNTTTTIYRLVHN